MAKFEISKEKGKPLHTKAPTIEQEREACEDNEQKYRDIEQEVKEAEPRKGKKPMSNEATDAAAKAMKQKSDAASASSTAPTAAADGQSIIRNQAAASVGIEASEAQEAKEKDGKMLTFIQQRKSVAKHEREKSAKSAITSKSISRKPKGLKRHEQIQKDLGRGERNK